MGHYALVGQGIHFSIAGLKAADVKLAKAAGKDVLLVERFDRIALDSGWA